MFIGTDLSGASFRDVVLTDAKINGLIDGLRINDIEVGPLIAAELGRRYPERVLLRSDDPVDLRHGWALIREQWDATLERIEHTPDDKRRQRVCDEWSALETLRHLIFVADDWFGRTVLGEPEPYWSAGLVPSFLEPFHPERLGLVLDTAPDFAEIRDRWGDRIGQLDAWFGNLIEAELERECPGSFSHGASVSVTGLTCAHAVLDEFWAHRRYAERDLDRIG